MPTQDPRPTKVKRSRKRMIAIVCACLLSGTIYLDWNWPGKLDFWIQGITYRRIVAEVKTHNVAPGEFLRGRQTFHGRHVFASREENGDWIIDIRTVDWGHIGYRGYIYTDGATHSQYGPRIDISALTNHWWVYSDGNQ